MSQQEIIHETDALGHFAWCLLVAVKLAQQSGKITGKHSEHLFIMNWLANAQKYKVFPRSVASDILWLQSEGKKSGVQARLLGNAEYWWKISSGQIAQQDDLFRLTYFIELARKAGLETMLVNTNDWESENYDYPNPTAVYMHKMDLVTAYDDSLTRLRPVEIRFTGNVADVLPAFGQAYLHHTPPVDVGRYTQIHIID